MSDRALNAYHRRDGSGCGAHNVRESSMALIQEIMKLVLGLAVFVCAAVAPAAAQSYPDHSRQLDEGPNVTVAYKINDDGQVSSCRVVKGSGDPQLDDASCGTVRTSVDGTLTSKDRHLDPEIERVIRWRLPPVFDTELEAARGGYPVALSSEARNVQITSEGKLPPARGVKAYLDVPVDTGGAVAACRSDGVPGIPAGIRRPAKRPLAGDTCRRGRRAFP